MLLRGHVRIEEDAYIIEIPTIQGVTYCRLNEDPLEYAEDYMRSMSEGDLDLYITWLEAHKSFLIRVADTAKWVGIILKAQRTLAGYSQPQVAAIMGKKSHTGVAAYEQGTRDPSLGTLTLMLDALGYDFEISIRKVPKIG